MKQHIGIWIDTKHAVIIKLEKNNHSIKKIESHIDTRLRIEGESKRYGRFGNQYLTYEKNRKNKRTLQTHKFIKSLFKEIIHCDSFVIFGPSTMKKELKKEINHNILFANKLSGVYKSELMTDNQMVAWVKNHFKNT